ncbi:Putative serine protease 61 [Gryllus bimaculatus]|nr:Putative serine protease 61 [Gryllus bimaculatus]
MCGTLQGRSPSRRLLSPRGQRARAGPRFRERLTAAALGWREAAQAAVESDSGGRLPPALTHMAGGFSVHAPSQAPSPPQSPATRRPRPVLQQPRLRHHASGHCVSNSLLKSPLVLLLVVTLATPTLQDVQSAVQAVTTFSNSLVPKLYQALAPGRENVVFAPFGLATNIAMLLEAAEGETAEEILRTFSIAPDARDELRQGFKAYFDTFEHAAAASAESGEAAGAFNMAMLRTAAILSPEYKTLLAKYYRANITEVQQFDNFTGSQPPALALELRTDSGVMSHWRDYQRLGVFTFLSHRGAAPFHRAPGDAVAVPMIPQVGVFRSGRLDHLACSAVELQLEVGAVNLLLLVPDAADSMDELLVKLSGVQFAHLPAWLAWGEREVALPQLAVLSSALDLAPFLRQLGLRRALNASAADLGRARARSPAAPAAGPSRLVADAPRLYLKSVTQDAYFSTSFVARYEIKFQKVFQIWHKNNLDNNKSHVRNIINMRNDNWNEIHYTIFSCCIHVFVSDYHSAHNMKHLSSQLFFKANHWE